MPDYKRKKVKRFFGHKKSRAKHETKSTAPKFKNKSSGIVPENEIKVVRGTKIKRQRKIRFLVGFVALICIVGIILNLALPVGLYENIVNFTATIGFGSYPTSVSGGNVINAISGGSYYYILTDTNIMACSNSGKIIFDELHGFSNPVLTTSNTRALIYDQGGKTAYIFNLNGKINTIQTEYEIITASISREGDFAIATHSDRYTSVATVYNKNAKKIYTWNSAKDIINNVLVNTNGKKLAITTINATSGKYDTKLMILDFKSADPIHTLNLEGSLPLSLLNTGKGISVVCSDKYKFVSWSKFNTNDLSASGEVNVLRNSKNGVLLVFNRANDRSDNTIVLLSKKGEKVSEFKLNTTITDIQYKNGRVYVLSDTSVTIYDKNGKILRQDECEYGIKKIAVISANTLAVISDNEIFKNQY